MSRKEVGVPGDRYDRLTLVERVPVPEGSKDSQTRWLCKCDCGNDLVVRIASVRAGLTKSCGCKQKETYRENFGGSSNFHGMSGTPLHREWVRAKENGGVDLIDRWKDSFLEFQKDVKELPFQGARLRQARPERQAGPGNIVWSV